MQKEANNAERKAQKAAEKAEQEPEKSAQKAKKVKKAEKAKVKTEQAKEKLKAERRAVINLRWHDNRVGMARIEREITATLCLWTKGCFRAVTRSGLRTDSLLSCPQPVTLQATPSRKRPDI